ncbi:PorP/SprF family type IX secretion system membrane protein [Compostibacter hankyongensis]|uniref:Type IX secretion system membrane protein PorP/SprF n=1 Tax=Compostibacter hankyongensis TaxID=1007089 RepID=A0ABP8G0J3_9BACT
MKKILASLGCLAAVILAALPQRSLAQVDAHFSQYYSNPMWLNPALTGVIDGDYRITANYKRQWAELSDPYSTGSISFDTYPFNNLGVGGTILNQSAGDGGWNYTNALLSAAYRVLLDASGMNALSIGIQGGIINRHVDISKLRFGSQYNPITGFDPGASSGETFPKTSSTAFDANFGIMYFNGNPNNTLNPFAGAAVYHLSRPDDPFLGTENERLPMRFDVHGGVRIKASDVINITPQALYMRQGNAHETALGLYGQYMLESQLTDLIFGATWRLQDAVVPYVGFHLGDFVLGVSYDVNVSKLRTASEGKGGIEFSLSFIPHKRITDPKFICPRL